MGGGVLTGELRRAGQPECLFESLEQCSACHLGSDPCHGADLRARLAGLRCSRSRGVGTAIDTVEPIDILSLTSGEFVAAAKARLARGAGVALRVYRRVIMDGRFEPQAFGLKDDAVADYRRHFYLRL